MGPPPSLTIPSAAGPLGRKLGQFVVITPEEAAVLTELQANTRTVQRHRDIITEGKTYSSLFVLIEGIAIRYRILHDGRRQIINVVLPGDIGGILGSFFENALFSTKALTDSVVAAIPFSKLGTLFETHPRLVTKIFWSFACEAAIYAEHVIDLGRRSALERIAHFLLELLTRLQAVGLADDRSYQIPLTQELIGDALGLSIPHVNRVLRRLRDDDLVSIEDQRVTIRDLEGLAELADFEPNYLRRSEVAELFESKE